MQGSSHSSRARPGAAKGAVPTRSSRLAQAVTFGSSSGSDSEADVDPSLGSGSSSSSAASSPAARNRRTSPTTGLGSRQRSVEKEPGSVMQRTSEGRPYEEEAGDGRGDVNGDDEDEDDDDYLRPELPLTDSRGERIAAAEDHEEHRFGSSLALAPLVEAPSDSDADEDTLTADSWGRPPGRSPPKGSNEDKSPMARYAQVPWWRVFDGAEDVHLSHDPLPYADGADSAELKSAAAPEISSTLSTFADPGMSQEKAPVTSSFRMYWSASKALNATSINSSWDRAHGQRSLAHGAHFVPLSTSNGTPELPRDASEIDTLYVLIHGAGQCALAWALCARALTRPGKETPTSVELFEPAHAVVPAAVAPTEGNLPHIQLGEPEARDLAVAIDLRAHGATTAPRNRPLTMPQLVADVAAVLRERFDFYGVDEGHMQRLRPKNVVLVGHILGGAIAVHLSHARDVDRKSPLIPNLLGVVVLDVVEGTAIDAVRGSSMRSTVMSRPTAFASAADAVLWAVTNHQVNNLESARISIPAQLEPLPSARDPLSHRVRWITDLMSTEPLWEGWFTDLSAKFLNARAARLLIVAGTDRLDKALTIGHMQGKFQLHVMQAAMTHAVHEDAPEEVAYVIAHFAARNVRLVLPRKPPGRTADAE